MIVTAYISDETTIVVQEGTGQVLFLLGRPARTYMLPISQAIHVLQTVAEEKRTHVKLRMAYVLCDYLGLSTSRHSKDIYHQLNQMGWHWFPSHLHWGEGIPHDNTGK